MDRRVLMIVLLAGFALVFEPGCGIAPGPEPGAKPAASATPGPGAGTPISPALVPEPSASPAPPAATPIPTEPNLKVAFLGDSGYGRDFESVLKLIEVEGADLVVHAGDFDYYDDPAGFEAAINRVLGPDFPYFLAVGNHDVGSWNAGCSNRRGCYAQYLKDRLDRLGVAPDDPNLNDQMYTVTYGGLVLVFVGQDGVRAGDQIYAPYLERQLSADNHLWRVAGWHKNQNALQVGGKGDEMGWRVYETARENGAIIATAHEHSYERTKTLVDVQKRTVDPEWTDPNRLRVGPGASFAFVSGLGGHSIRRQLRCRPTTYPYGCSQEWASIYTADQGARFGALFLTFNVDGDPARARGYFKNVSGQVVDEFEVVAFR